jgi:hypothetical protein
MSRIGSPIRLAASLCATVLAIGACSGSGSATQSATRSAPQTATAAASATPSVAPSVATATAQPSAQPASWRLVVLGNGIDGVMGLWTLDSSAAWKRLGATPGATGLGTSQGGVMVAADRRIETRPWSALSRVGLATTLKWPAGSAAAPVVGLATSPAGKVAVAAANDQGQAYGVVGSGGTVVAVTPAPADSFTPLVAWLDEARLLVLSTDAQQVSRLAVINTVTHSIQPSQTVPGAHLFAVSGNRQLVVASTEKAIYAEPANSLLGGTTPQSVVTLQASQVVWALALDTDGSRVFMLSGTEAADGTVGAIHELGYVRKGASWVRFFDTPAPFNQAIAQAWIP